MTEPRSGRDPVLALLKRLLWGAVLALPVFGAEASAVLTTLYSFKGFPNGAVPQAGLVQGRDGFFYGTTSGGGTNFNGGYGTVFRISATGVLTTLYSFSGGNDGGNPVAGLVQGSDGNFYGTTEENGGADVGTVFKITTNGVLTTLFTCGANASSPSNPYAGLVQGSDGDFYGTTYYGGGNPGNGTVIKINPNTQGTSFYPFGKATNGANPTAALVQGSDGYFYGTTEYGGTTNQGTVFRITTNGVLTRLYSFTNGIDGANPVAALVQGSDGDFYGTAGYGGNHNYGTVFRITTNGVLTSLYSFTGGDDGANPQAALVQGSDGSFYGTAYYGGKDGYGTVFKINTNGVLTRLYSFTGGADGATPAAGLVQGSDGRFYGTTSGGNGATGGTIFRLTIVPEFQAFTITNSALNLTWSTEAGGTYQLQFNSDLSSANWTNLSSAATAPGATLSTTDSVTNSPRRFYRLVLSP